MSDKPTLLRQGSEGQATCEWTVAEPNILVAPTGHRFIIGGATDEHKRVAKRINAALAAQAYQHGLLHGETLKQLAAEQDELERERMRHAACGVIALSNTRKSLDKNRVMKPEYLSASVQECIKAVEREIELREQLAAEREKWQEELKRQIQALSQLHDDEREGWRKDLAKVQ